MTAITENDVRLMRRILVALQGDDVESANKIAWYLAAKGLKFTLPGYQTEATLRVYFQRLDPSEQYLARTYGAVLLPDYDGQGHNDIVFLNSKWANPYTLYVRLVEPVPDLGELGQLYWVPETLQKTWENLAEASDRDWKAHFRPTPAQPQKKLTMWQQVRMWLGLGAILLILLSGCANEGEAKLRADLAACQTFVIYQDCLLQGLEQDFCDDYLCSRYPEAQPCLGSK